MSTHDSSSSTSQISITSAAAVTERKSGNGHVADDAPGASERSESSAGNPADGRCGDTKDGRRCTKPAGHARRCAFGRASEARDDGEREVEGRAAEGICLVAGCESSRRQVGPYAGLCADHLAVVPQEWFRTHELLTAERLRELAAKRGAGPASSLTHLERGGEVGAVWCGNAASFSSSNPDDVDCAACMEVARLEVGSVEDCEREANAIRDALDRDHSALSGLKAQLAAAVNGGVGDWREISAAAEGVAERIDARTEELEVALAHSALARQFAHDARPAPVPATTSDPAVALECRAAELEELLPALEDAARRVGGLSRPFGADATKMQGGGGADWGRSFAAQAATWAVEHARNSAAKLREAAELVRKVGVS